MASTETAVRTGLTLTGEFLSVGQESGTIGDREWSAGVVKLLDGDFTMRVKFADEAAAVAALGGTVPERGDLVTLPVRAQGGWDDSAGRRSKVTYRGVER